MPSPTSACSQLTQASADTGTRGVGTTPGPMQCTRHLLYVGWKERKGEQSTGSREGSAPTRPSHRSCQPGMFAIMVSHTGAARGKLDPRNTAYPSQDPSARCCLRQKSRPFCRVSLVRKKTPTSGAAQSQWLLHQGHPFWGFDGPIRGLTGESMSQTDMLFRISESKWAPVGCVSAACKQGTQPTTSCKIQAAAKSRAGRTLPVSPSLVPTNLCSAS